MPLPTHRPPSGSSSRRGGARGSGGGFALVVALALMGFLLLLLVSLAALVQVEARRGAAELAQLEARQNALFGLKMAIAQLQSAAGPDQRVTARADILTPDARDFGTGKRHWTGVWPTDSDAGPIWLVSHAENAGSPTADPTTAWPATISTFEVVRTPSPAGSVRVGGVPIVGDDGRRAGTYAYWVGDEGIKAKVNLPADVSPATSSNRYTTTTSRRFGLELISGLDEIGDALDGSEPDGIAMETLSRIRNFSQIQLLSSTIAGTVPNLFHDLTTYSYGVLANTRDGGLRRDLTARLSSEVEIEGLLWEYPGYNGPSWELLRRYFRLVEQTASFTDDEIPALPLQRGHDPDQLNLDLNWGDLLSYPRSPALMPILIWMGMTYGTFATAENDPNDPDTRAYRLHVSMKPVVVLWNPYDVTIDNDMGFVVNIIASNSAPRHLSPKFRLRNSQASGQLGFVHLASLLPGHPVNPGTESNLRFLGPRFSIAPTELLPGEVAAFSLPAGTAEPYTFLTADDVDEDLFDSDPDFARGGPVLERGFRPAPFVSVPIHSGNTAHTTDDWAVINADMGRVAFRSDGQPIDANNPPNLRFEQTRSGRLFLAFDRGQLYFERTPESIANHRLGRSHKMLTNNSVMISAAGSAFDSGALFETADAFEDLMLYDGELNFQPIDFASWALSLATPQLASSRSLKLVSQYNFRVAHSAGTNLNWITPNHLGSISPIYTGITSGGMYADQFDPLSGEEGGSLFSLSQLREVTAPDGTERTIGPIFFHVPRHEIVSLGQLMHLDLTRSVWSPTYTIGNSMASPWIESTQILNTAGSYHISDQSYLANDALWDGYFFSTVRALPAAPLNTRLHYFSTDPASTAVTDSELQTSAALLIDGHFNINSTSVEAWKAVLAGLNKTELTFSDPTNPAASDSNIRLKNPFPRSAYHSLHGGTPTRPNESATDWDLDFESWNRIPELSANAIDQLAHRIVFELRTRGSPFRSLAEFVNREPNFPFTANPSGTRNPRMMGILQRALNAPYTTADTLDGSPLNGSPINPTGLEGDQVGPAIETMTHVYPNAALGLLAEGVPGYIAQADILQAIAAMIAARSDTFVVRAYGDAGDPSIQGRQLSGRAWCEAIIQRLPYYVDDSIAPHLVPPPNSINDRFGRRFKMISFRWIEEEEL